MATIGNDVITLTDWAKRNDPQGKTPMIVEILSQSNKALEEVAITNFPSKFIGMVLSLNGWFYPCYWNGVTLSISSDQQ